MTERRRQAWCLGIGRTDVSDRWRQIQAAFIHECDRLLLSLILVRSAQISARDHTTISSRHRLVHWVDFWRVLPILCRICAARRSAYAPSNSQRFKAAMRFLVQNPAADTKVLGSSRRQSQQSNLLLVSQKPGSTLHHSSMQALHAVFTSLFHLLADCAWGNAQ